MDGAATDRSRMRDHPNGMYDPRKHHLRGHDYSGGGPYFVTTCGKARLPLFRRPPLGQLQIRLLGVATGVVAVGQTAAVAPSGTATLTSGVSPVPPMFRET